MFKLDKNKNPFRKGVARPRPDGLRIENAVEGAYPNKAGCRNCKNSWPARATGFSQ
jgi:hypothetical protein